MFIHKLNYFEDAVKYFRRLLIIFGSFWQTNAHRTACLAALCVPYEMNHAVRNTIRASSHHLLNIEVHIGI